MPTPTPTPEAELVARGWGRIGRAPTPAPEGTLPPIRADMVEAVRISTPLRANWVIGLDEELAAQIVGLPWIEDGMPTNLVNFAAGALTLVADAGHLAKLIEEPWVVEGRNLEALMNLSAGHPPGLLNWVFQHPAANDGITYRESKIIAMMGNENDVSFLDPGSPHTLEERTINLPWAGDIELNILRDDPALGYAGMMDDLEAAVRSHEAFMGLPFPQQQVNYRIVPGSGGGHVEMFTWIGHDTGGPKTVSHEAAHFYWSWPRAPWVPHNLNLAWLDEGAADLLANGPDAARDDLWNADCVGLTIPDLEASDYWSSETRCWYPVGEAFYRDLYRAMDPTNFRLGFRRWFLHRLVDVADVCPPNMLGRSTTYCHVMEAFMTYASDDNRAAVEDIVNRWYGVTAATPPPTPTPVPQSDRDALVALHKTLGGPNWANWLSDAHIGNWGGVTIDADGRLTRLWLWFDSFEVSSELSLDLGSFPNLWELIIERSDSLTELELVNSPNLADLTIKGNNSLNRLKLGSFPNLVDLNLSENDALSGLELDSHPSLVKLNIWENDSLSRLVLGSFPNLVELSIGDNDSLSVLEWGNLPNLAKLSIYGNDSLSVLELGSFPSLVEMDLSQNNLTGTIPPELAEFSNLKKLWISGNELTGCIPASLNRAGLDLQSDLEFCP